MQLTDDFKQTNDGGSSNTHGSFDTERSPYRQMCSHTGAFAISNMFIAGLGIHIKYCTAWTMVIMAIVLAISAVAFIAKMEGQ